MKVCTDACLFGAWVTNKIIADKLILNNCLDIGTGTGLLSLMLAQKNTAFEIDAIEIEENAFNQAQENFDNSPWNNRIKVFNADAKEYVYEKKYDLIISNPPFFETDLLSAAKSKNLAKHNAGLLFINLIEIADKNLSHDGFFTVLLPFSRTEEFIKLAEVNSFYLQEKLLVRQTPSHNFFRSMLFFTKTKTNLTAGELIIKNDDGNYTPEFSELLKDYYLYL